MYRLFYYHFQSKVVESINMEPMTTKSQLHNILGESLFPNVLKTFVGMHQIYF